jgi:dihydrofolate reductase
MPNNVIWHVTMSLDGFVAGPADEMEWAFRYGKPGPMGNEVIARTGAILAGRRGFDLGTKPGRQARGIYGGAWSGPMFVLTHHRDDAPEMPRITYLPGGIEDAVAAARAAAGEKKPGNLRSKQFVSTTLTVTARSSSREAGSGTPGR